MSVTTWNDPFRLLKRLATTINVEHEAWLGDIGRGVGGFCFLVLPPSPIRRWRRWA